MRGIFPRKLRLAKSGDADAVRFYFRLLIAAGRGEQVRAVMQEAVSTEDLKASAALLVAKAKAGDPDAALLLMELARSDAMGPHDPMVVALKALNLTEADWSLIRAVSGIE